MKSTVSGESQRILGQLRARLHSETYRAAHHPLGAGQEYLVSQLYYCSENREI